MWHKLHRPASVKDSTPVFGWALKHDPQEKTHGSSHGLKRSGPTQGGYDFVIHPHLSASASRLGVFFHAAIRKSKACRSGEKSLAGVNGMRASPGLVSRLNLEIRWYVAILELYTRPNRLSFCFILGVLIEDARSFSISCSHAWIYWMGNEA